MIQNPNRDFPITTDGKRAEARFIGWIQSVTEALNFLEPMEGIVSPEGVVFAPAKKYYFDTVGKQLYFKTTGVALNTGWVRLT